MYLATRNLTRSKSRRPELELVPANSFDSRPPRSHGDLGMGVTCSRRTYGVSMSPNDLGALPQDPDS